MEKTNLKVQSSTRPATSNAPRPHAPLSDASYSLRRHLGFWELVFEGKTAILKHEQGLFYISYPPHHPPDEPLHGVALALAVRQLYGKPTDEAQLIQQRAMGLDDAESFRLLRIKQKELEAILDDPEQIEPVKAEATRELIEIYEFQRKHPWRTRDSAQKTVNAVALSIKRFRNRLEQAALVQNGGQQVLGRFAKHLAKYLVVPTGRGRPEGRRFGDILAGCFTYHPPFGVKWE